MSRPRRRPEASAEPVQADAATAGADASGVVAAGVVAAGAARPAGAWQRIRPMRASDEIVRQFRHALFEGRLRAGEPVGSEQQLAVQFGVSRTTVRDALRSLEAAGIVEIRTGVKGGVRIAQGDPNRFADGLAVQLKLVGLDPRDALAAQMGLEWVAAELAATSATDADLAALEALLTEAAGLVDAGPAFTTSATAFHEAVAHASHNWAIETSLRAIREVVHELHVQNTIPSRARRVVDTHRQIYEAVQARDPQRASALMRAHISATLSSTEDAYGRRPATSA